MSNNQEYVVEKVGVFTPKPNDIEELSSGEIGFISSVTEPFCGGCVRARLSSDGKLFTCLFSNKGYDLADRLTFSEPIQVLTAEISKIWSARSDRYSELTSPKPNSLPRVEMSYIGG